VKRPTLESLRAGNLRDVGNVEHADRRHDDVELMSRAVRRLDDPFLLLVPPPQCGDAGTADQMLLESVLGGDLLQVGEDLRLLGERLTPSWVGANEKE
jgi:hypothetical protein